jgi:phosphoesterase RecJ-like protein
MAELDNGECKMSFRSKGDVPANAMAEEFGGGGHLNAAGARTENETLETLYNKIVAVVKKHMP